LEDGMTFPDRIERILDLDHAPATVWAALTTPEGLGTWFGSSAEVDLRPGGEVKLVFDENHRTTLEIKVVEPITRFAYAWPLNGLPDDDPRRTFVEFMLEPVAEGTRLTLVESGFAQAPDTALKANTEGWGYKLGELADYLDK
jgi:uncharacterized protein YndB with AHSA1/START domain